MKGGVEKPQSTHLILGEELQSQLVNFWSRSFPCISKAMVCDPRKSHQGTLDQTTTVEPQPGCREGVLTLHYSQTDPPILTPSTKRLDTASRSNLNRRWKITPKTQTWPHIQWHINPNNGFLWLSTLLISLCTSTTMYMHQIILIRKHLQLSTSILTKLVSSLFSKNWCHPQGHWDWSICA